MGKPKLYLIAGLNGAGKSTSAEKYAEKEIIPKCINPDKINKVIRIYLFIQDKKHFIDITNYIAILVVQSIIYFKIIFKLDVAFETVLSTNKYELYLREARMNEFEINMFFVALSSVELNLGRIKNRVLDGGHDVPENKVRERYQRSLDNLETFIFYVDNLRVIDNSNIDETILIAEKRDGEMIIYRNDLLVDVQKVIRKFI